MRLFASSLLPMLIGLFFSQVSWAEGKIGDALDEARDAMDAVSDASRDCKKAVMKDLEDVVDSLKSLKRDFSRKKARLVLEDLRALKKSSRDECNEKIERKIRRALDILESALDKDHDGDDDNDRREHHRVVIDCWNESDPGCKSTKGGNPPMGKAAFDGFMQAIRGSKPHVFPMKDMAANGLANTYLTSMQLGVLVEEFKPHVQVMLDVIKLAAPRLVDPKNGLGVSTKLQPHTFLVQDAAALISAQRGD